MTAVQPTTSAARSTPLDQRALAPDLARGMMLLLIVLAHVPWFLYTSDVGSAMLHPDGGSLLDRIAQSFTLTVVDARVHTMFGFLFAYGIGQMYARQIARGTPERDVRRLLRTRHLWLIVFGVVHAVLLWQGDILGIYGLLGLIMVPLFFGRSDRTLLVWIVVFLSVGALFTALSTIGTLLMPGLDASVGTAQHAATGAETWWAALGPRLSTWATGLAGGVFTLALPTAFLLGLLAARRRMLDEPARHLPLLRWTAAVGIGLGWSTGLLLALAHVGVVPLSAAALGSVHFFAGIFTGPGYAAVFGLIAHRISTRGSSLPAFARGIRALGRRSLSGYLTQSLFLAPVLGAWGLGLGAHLTSITALLYGVAVWVLTVVAASLLERAGRRGPAEVLLRTLTYRSLRRTDSHGHHG